MFLDRDGTVIRHVHHLVDPGLVEVFPTAAEGIRRLRAAGIPVVIATNQSVVGRGMIDEIGLERVHTEMSRQLRDAGTQVDAIYWCGHFPDSADETMATHPDRKPAPGMLIRAGRELGLDLPRSWMVGDTLRDTRAGRAAGCCGNILVLTGAGGLECGGDSSVDYVAKDLVEASDLIIRGLQVDLPNETTIERQER